MNDTLRTQMDNLYSTNKDVQNQAYTFLMAATAQPVPWAYEVWDELLVALRHKDNHVRAIAAQVLCNLAQSDPEQRMLRDVAALLIVTKDERFVTARHCIQSLWKVGVAGETQQNVLLAGLEQRFHECHTEKNCTLIRYDILQSLRNVYDVTKDEQIKAKALALIDIETDLKYRKKYTALWKFK